MNEKKESTDRLINKLKVLESRIDKLEIVTDEILNEVNSVYKDEVNRLKKKREIIKNQLEEIREISDP